MWPNPDPSPPPLPKEVGHPVLPWAGDGCVLLLHPRPISVPVLTADDEGVSSIGAPEGPKVNPGSCAPPGYILNATLSETERGVESGVETVVVDEE